MIVKITIEEGSLDGTPPEDYLDSQMRSMIINTSKGWRGIGSSGKM